MTEHRATKMSYVKILDALERGPISAPALSARLGITGKALYCRLAYLMEQGKITRLPHRQYDLSSSSRPLTHYRIAGASTAPPTNLGFAGPPVRRLDRESSPPLKRERHGSGVIAGPPLYSQLAGWGRKW